MKLKNGDFVCIDGVLEGVYDSLLDIAVSQGFSVTPSALFKPKYMYIRDNEVRCSASYLRNSYLRDSQTNKLLIEEWLATSATWKPVIGKPVTFNKLTCKVEAIVGDRAWINVPNEVVGDVALVVDIEHLTEVVKSLEVILFEDIKAIAQTGAFTYEVIAEGLIAAGYIKKGEIV